MFFSLEIITDAFFYVSWYFEQLRHDIWACNCPNDIWHLQNHMISVITTDSTSFPTATRTAIEIHYWNSVLLKNELKGKIEIF